MSESPWPTIHVERLALLDDLRPLRPEQWEARSLCTDWTVRQAFGHMIATGGLAGQRASSVTQPAMTVLFADCILAEPGQPYGWHGAKPAGSVAAMDGHVEARTAVTVTNMLW